MQASDNLCESSKIPFAGYAQFLMIRKERAEVVDNFALSRREKMGPRVRVRVELEAKLRKKYLFVSSMMGEIKLRKTVITFHS